MKFKNVFTEKKLNHVEFVTISETDFEINDIDFINKEYDMLDKEFSRLHGKSGHEEEVKRIYGHLCSIDSIREMASEDIGDYGQVSEEINRDLWDKNQNEKTYEISLALWYTTTQDYFGEIDVDVDFKYEVLNEIVEQKG